MHRSAARLLRAVVRLPAAAAVLAIRGYQLLISPLLGPTCRYAPSCSAYGAQAITQRGLVVGAALTSWRLLRCNPWSPGGYDPVPARARTEPTDLRRTC